MRTLLVIALTCVAGGAFAWREYRGTAGYYGATVDVTCDNGETYRCYGGGSTCSDCTFYMHGLASSCCLSNGTTFTSDEDDLGDRVVVNKPLSRSDIEAIEDKDHLKLLIDAVWLSRQILRSKGVVDAEAPGARRARGEYVCLFENWATQPCCPNGDRMGFQTGRCAACATDTTCLNGKKGRGIVVER